MIKLEENWRLVQIYQRHPQGITSLLKQCEPNNTQCKELLFLIFLNFRPQNQKYIISISKQRSEVSTQCFKAINICHAFFDLHLKGYSRPLDLKTKQPTLFGFTEYYLLRSYDNDEVFLENHFKKLLVHYLVLF